MVLLPSGDTVNTNEANQDPEAAPLLVHERGHRKATPLPLLQLLILAAVRLAEPIGVFQIFPYVNQMIEDLGIASPTDVGYYSGMIDSAFSFAELFTIFFWSSLSDRIGRKPVIMIGVSGAALGSVCFGFSSSLPEMLFARSLAGALSGNMAVVSSMLCEITDETNQGKAFPLIAATWYIGSIIGPMIGGNLSNPMKKWPEVFRDYPLFQAYPYLLPCVVSSSLSVFAIAMCGFFVRETLPSKVTAQYAAAEQKKFGLSKIPSYGTIHTSTSTRAPSPNPPSTPSVTDASEASTPTFTILEEQDEISNSEHAAVAAKTASVFHLLSSPHVRAVLATSFMFSLLGIGFEVVFVLYSHTRVHLGGMGRSPAQIGFACAGSGAVGIVILLALFPFIQQRFNNRRLYTFFSTFWALAFSLMPIGNFATRLPMGGDQNKKDAVEWVAITLILIPIKIAMNVYPLNLVILKASVDSHQLGKMFGLQQTCSSVARGIAPIFVSSLFAFSLDHQILGGHFVWLVLFLLSLVAVRLSMRVRDVPAPRPV